MNRALSPRTLLVAAAVAVVVIGVVLWLVLRPSGRDTDRGSAAGSPSTSATRPTPTGTGTASIPSMSAPSAGTPSAHTPSESTLGPTPTDPTIATQAPVGLTDSASLDNGDDKPGSARITRIESVTSKATMPGELSRPALRFTIAITAGSVEQDLGSVVVNAYYGSELTPAIGVSQPGGVPFGGTLKPGATRTGVYVFNVPVKERSDVRLEIGYSAKRPLLTFQGPVG